MLSGSEHWLGTRSQFEKLANLGPDPLPKIAPSQPHRRAKTGRQTQTAPIKACWSVPQPCNGPKQERRPLLLRLMRPEGGCLGRRAQLAPPSFGQKSPPARHLGGPKPPAKRKPQPLVHDGVFPNPAMDPNMQGAHFFNLWCDPKGAARVPARSSQRPVLAKNRPQPGTSAGRNRPPNANRSH